MTGYTPGPGVRVLCAHCYQIYSLGDIKKYVRWGMMDEWTTPCCGQRADNDPFHKKPYFEADSKEYREAERMASTGYGIDPFLVYERIMRQRQERA